MASPGFQRPSLTHLFQGIFDPPVHPFGRSVSWHAESVSRVFHAPRVAFPVGGSAIVGCHMPGLVTDRRSGVLVWSTSAMRFPRSLLPRCLGISG